MSAMGSCIKVVKQKNWFPTEKKVVSCNRVKPKQPLFCHGYSHAADLKLGIGKGLKV
jgi:hypothetical protein